MATMPDILWGFISLKPNYPKPVFCPYLCSYPRVYGLNPHRLTALFPANVGYPIFYFRYSCVFSSGLWPHSFKFELSNAAPPNLQIAVTN